MKRLIWGIISVLVCSCAGCGTKQEGEVALRELTRAENVMFDYPDSALHILQAMPVPAGEEQHALWCLLTTQAAYKQFLPIPSDSLIRIAYDYYRNTDDARRKAMAALYMGGVNYDLGRAEQAIRYYAEADKYAALTDDYTLRYLIMSSLGTVYLYRDLADYALESGRKAYEYSRKSPYRRYEVDALMGLGRTYCIKNSLDTAIVYYHRAIDLASISDSASVTAIERELAGIYINRGDHRQALSLLQNIITKDKSPQFFYCLGETYLNLERYDSAHYYLTQALHGANLYTRTATYECLFRLSHQPAYRKYMGAYGDSLFVYQDSVLELDKGKEIIAYKEKYKHQKLVNENQRLELEKAKVVYWLMLFVILVLFLVALFIYIHLRRQKALRRKEEELNKLVLSLHENEALIKRNTNYIAALEAEIAQSSDTAEQLEEQQKLVSTLQDENRRLQTENGKLKNRIEHQDVSSYDSTEIKRITEELYAVKQQKEHLSAWLVEEHPYLLALHSRPVYLKDEDLKQLRQLTDVIYAEFCRRLHTDVPALSDNEITLCCLIKLRFTVSEIAVLLGISASSVSTGKFRIKNKIYTALGIPPKKMSLDLWIWGY